LHAVNQFLCVCSVVFGEIHIYEAGQSVAVGSHSHHSILVGVAVNDLLLQTSSFISWAGILTLLGVNGVSAKDPGLLLSIELFNRCLFFLLDPCLVLGLHFSDLGIVLFLEGLVFLHDTVHITLIHIHYNYFLTLFQCLIFVFQA
jgi:hypothetical protein